ncbi:GNAT family N-acetyltransferase [candidate division WOR-3 bacterium]|nr:GNAT family N-acetyltransferase [candidate division WOR-3 bacterium]
MKVEIISDCFEKFPEEGIFHRELVRRAGELLGCKTGFFSAKTQKIEILFYTFSKGQKMTAVPTLPYSCVVSVEGENTGKSFERHYLCAVEKISEILPKKTVILASPDIFDVRPFIWCGFKAEILYTYVASLDWDKASIEREELKQIKKAENEARFFEDWEDKEELVELLFSSYKRHGRKPPYDKKYIIEMARKAEELSVLKLRTATDPNGRPIAFRASLTGSEKSYDWIAGSSQSGLEIGANAMLLQRSIFEEVSKGRKFDLCGANTRSISLFKAGFGLKLNRYSRLWR